jgi:hypothetical protein
MSLTVVEILRALESYFVVVVVVVVLLAQTQVLSPFPSYRSK